MNRVAITGVGLLTGLGVGRRENWKRLIDGDTAIRPIEHYEPDSFRTRLAAEIVDFDPGRWADRRALRLTTRNDQYALAGASLAVEDAEIDITAIADPSAVGLFVGGRKEISNPDHMLAGALSARRDDGVADIRRLGRTYSSSFHPLYYVEGLQAASLFHISQRFGITGPNAYFHGTADAGITAVARGYRSVARGEASVAIVGGFDDAASWWSMSRLDAMGVLSDSEDPADFRPFDVERSGSFLGDGAAFLLLEDLDHAARRGAHVYAEITGGAATRDSTVVTPQPGGDGLAAAIERVCRRSPVQVDLVVAHGCGTEQGDASEARALSAVLGDEVCGTAVKPATGHLVAGAGALNVAVCALAIDSAVVPAITNLRKPDPQCSFGWLAGQPRDLHVRGAVAVGRGLEGQQAVVALREPTGRRGEG